MEVTVASPPPPSSSHLWDEVIQFTKCAQERPMDPLAWAIQISSFLGSAGVELPSPELAQLLVSHVCCDHNVATAWKYLEQAIASRLAPAMLVIAHLSTRVIPMRLSRPSAYRIYMEILKKYLLSFSLEISESSYKRCMTSVDDVLQLSSKFGFQVAEPGNLVVEFVFCVLWQLLDASLDDEGLLHLTAEKSSIWEITSQDMEIDGVRSFNEKRIEYSDKLSKANTAMAIELMTQFLQDKVISRILNLARENMQSKWDNFSMRLHVLAINSLALRSSTISQETILQFSLEDQHLTSQKHRYSTFNKSCAFTSMTSPGGYIHGGNHSSLWIPLDLYLEYAIDGSIGATNAIKVISGFVKALKALNRTTWHDTFLGLWMAALRLVQRERDPIEGPSPHVDTRLCILLSIMTLTVADIIEDEADSNDDNQRGQVSQLREEGATKERHSALVSSLQMLGNYEALLVPPLLVITAANQAAAKAMIFLSGIPVASGYGESLALNDKALNCSGNMRHLIVEACIARNLLDTSAYFWSGYINGSISQIPHSIPTQVPGWSSLMKGAPLTSSMTNILRSTPASSLMELEKIYEIAINGSTEDKISAATILCGASLIRGWNIQEHTVRLAVKVLSPPIPSGYAGNDSHLISHAPMLNVILTGISSIDCVQIFSFHGLIPELAGALMPICEAFGSCTPSMSWSLPEREEISVHTVFSNAFVLLLRLWRFNHPPIEYCMLGDAAPVGSQLTPEYLLFLRNSVISSSGNAAKCKRQNKIPPLGSVSEHPIFLDSFPKLKLWYTQHQACLASTLSGNVLETPVHQNVDSLLNMMFWKANKGSSLSVGSVTSGSSSLSSSSGPGTEDNPYRPKLPAWDIMEAVPFVVDAALTACSHGILSPRELATGLKDLADFLPASLATIVSYFCAEVTRGVWKPAYMNGTDWPSPAANLATVEEHIKKIVAATGADVPSLVTGNSPATLPLPLAAFVSLTITYRLDKASERFLNLAGPALERLAASCPWPSMPIVAALWAQKVKRWSDFLTFSASSTVFHHNNDAVVKLLQSCFTAVLGLSNNSILENGGVGSFLGHGFGLHYSGGLSPVAPGILFLQIHRDVRDIVLLTEQILSVLMFSVRELASDGLSEEMREKLKKSKYGLKYGHISLLSGLSRLKVAASLASTLIWLSGGSSLINCLFREILPTRFLSTHASSEGVKECVTSMLEGCTLAHFAVICGMFAWGVDSTSNSKRRSKAIGAHLGFLADALDGKISLGCSWGTWHAYVVGFLSLIIECAPCWILEVELPLLKRLSNGLRLCNETELAILLLSRGGAPAMGAAAEIIVGNQ